MLARFHSGPLAFQALDLESSPAPHFRYLESYVLSGTHETGWRERHMKVEHAYHLEWVPGKGAVYLYDGMAVVDDTLVHRRLAWAAAMLEGQGDEQLDG